MSGPLELDDAMKEFEPTAPLKWYSSNEHDSMPEQGLISPDYTLHLNHIKYFVHVNKLNDTSVFFSSSFLSMPSSKRETNLTELLPPSCHGVWEIALDFMYQSACTVSLKNVVPLFKIAHALRVPSLARHCIEWLKHNLDATNAFVTLSAVYLNGPGLEHIQSFCLQIITTHFRDCDFNSFLSLDLESLKSVLVTASSICQQRQKVSDVAVNYIRHVQESDQEAVFVQLSECVSQVHSKDAIYLYGLSLNFGLDSISAMCLSVINENHRDLDFNDSDTIQDDTVRFALMFRSRCCDGRRAAVCRCCKSRNMRGEMYAMDVRTVVDVLEVAVCHFGGLQSGYEHPFFLAVGKFLAFEYWSRYASRASLQNGLFTGSQLETELLKVSALVPATVEAAKIIKFMKEEMGTGIQLFVKSLTGATYTFLVSDGPTITVHTCKRYLEMRYGIPINARLIFAGQQLEDSRTLSSYNIQNYATFHLVLF